MLTIDPKDLAAIQAHFHAVILGRADEFGLEHPARLPELAELLASGRENAWFPVGGMYGGFSYWFAGEGEAVKLVCESWCRIMDYSEQIHEITPKGSRLVDSGYGVPSLDFRQLRD